MDLFRYFPCAMAALLMVFFSSCKKDPQNTETQTPGSLPGIWQQTNGPCNGLIRGVAISGNTIYANWEGVYSTTNAGVSWSQVATGMDQWDSPVAILVHHDTLLAAADGIFRSTDNGQTWTAYGTDKLYCCVLDMAWTGNTVVVCTYNYGPLFISNDKGVTWNEAEGSIPGFGVRCATILGQDIFVASSGNGIYKSSDNGQSFTACGNGLGTMQVYSLETGVDKIYAGTADGLFSSSDHGANWVRISDSKFQNRTISQIVVDGPVILAGGFYGLLISMDGGVTWSEAINGLTEPRIESLAVSGSTFLAGTQSGVYISENSGQTWRSIGLPVTNVKYFSSVGTDIFACASQMSGGIFVTPDGGSNWSFLRGGLPTYNINCVTANGTDLLACGDSGVFISTDHGINWVKKSNGIPEMDPYNTINCVAGNGEHLFAGTYSTGIYVSHNGGQSWTHASLPIDDHYFASCMYVNATGIYAGTFVGGLLFSSDNGQTWTNLNSGLPVAAAITSIVQNGSNLFLSTFGGVYCSTDGGHSWGPVGMELYGKVIFSLATHGSDLFAGTAENGVCMSKNQGKSWFAVNAGFPADTRAYSLAVNGSWLLVGTDGKGAWRHPL